MKMVNRGVKFAELFKHFTNHCWYFETGNTDDMLLYFTELDLELFPFDLCLINWNNYFNYFGYGLSKFMLKDEQTPNPTLATSKDLLIVEC